MIKYRQVITNFQPNPMETPVESVLMAFMMSTGELEPVWNALPLTNHIGTSLDIIGIIEDKYLHSTMLLLNI